MAPRKRAVKGTPAGKADAAPPPGRVTRSSVRRGSEALLLPVNTEIKKTKKAAVGRGRGAKAKKKVEAENGHGRSEVREEEAEEKVTVTKTIIIEHCKQCQSFKKRAEAAKKGLEEGLPGVVIVFNPEKPRRGCFEIREEGGEKFVTLLDLKRPFNMMKDLDMEQVTKDIIDKLK